MNPEKLSERDKRMIERGRRDFAERISAHYGEYDERVLQRALCWAEGFKAGARKNRAALDVRSALETFSRILSIINNEQAPF